MRNFLSIGRFKSKTIRFLRFKNTFNRKAIRIMFNSKSRTIISIRIIRNNEGDKRGIEGINKRKRKRKIINI